jgi:hypothetical protein
VKKQHVINYDYSEKTGLVEKFIILVLVLWMFSKFLPHSYLKLKK